METNDILPMLPTGLQEMLWNLGVFYTLHTLHYTRLANNYNTKIRLSPEVWTELLVAYERLDLFPAFSSQASRIFRLLVSNDVFQYAIYTGAATLYRVMRVVQENTCIPPPTSASSASATKPSLAACVQTNKDIQQRLIFNTDLLVREISPVPPLTTSILPASTSSSSAARQLLLATGSSRSSSISGHGQELGVVDDSSLLDLFDTPGDDVSSTQPRATSSLSSSSLASVAETIPDPAITGNVMAALEALEASSKEIVGNNVLVAAGNTTSRRHPERTSNKQSHRKKRPVSEREAVSSGKGRGRDSGQTLQNPNKNKNSKRSRAAVSSKTPREESLFSAASVLEATMFPSSSSSKSDRSGESRHDNSGIGSGLVFVGRNGAAEDMQALATRVEEEVEFDDNLNINFSSNNNSYSAENKNKNRDNTLSGGSDGDGEGGGGGGGGSMLDMLSQLESDSHSILNHTTI